MLAAALGASTLSIAEQRADQVVWRAPPPGLPTAYPLGFSGILYSRTWTRARLACFVRPNGNA